MPIGYGRPTRPDTRHQFAAVRPQPIQDDQQWLLDMRFECLQEFDDLFFLDAPFVQAKRAIGAGQSGNDRDVIPVEVELDDRRASLGNPSA